MHGDRLKEARKGKPKWQASLECRKRRILAMSVEPSRRRLPALLSSLKRSGVTTDYLCGLSDNPQGTSERPILDATCEAIIAKLMGAPDDVVREAMNYVEYLTAKAERRMRQERKERDSLKRMADKGDAEKGEP